MNVTIDDDSGILEDNYLASNVPTWNLGGRPEVSPISVDGTRYNAIFKIILTAYSDVTVTTAHFGVDVHSATTVPMSAAWYKVLRDWGEGSEIDGPEVGASDWDFAIRPSVLWDTAGCEGTEGADPDRESVADGTVSITGVTSDQHLVVTNTLTQDWIDNSSTNFGLLLRPENPSRIAWRSSQTVAGNKPYFYMEYTEAAPGWNSNSYYGNRKIASINSPQRSRRIY